MKRFLAVLLLASMAAFADDTEPVSKTVDYLIAAVEKSDLKFLRNGDEHAPKAAAEHMRKKFNHFKKDIKTPEDFIAKCASKSELSGKPYMVKKPDGTTEKCEDWLRAKLEEHRKEPEKR